MKFSWIGWKGLIFSESSLSETCGQSMELLIHSFWIAGIVVYHDNRQYILTSRNGQSTMMPVYPSGSSLWNVSLIGNYQNQSAFSQPGARVQLNTTLPCYLNSGNNTEISLKRVLSLWNLELKDVSFFVSFFS